MKQAILLITPAHAAFTRRQVLALGGLTLSPLSFAQRTYPDHAVKVVVPNAPGSSVDTIGRVVCIELARLLAQPMVMDNRAGAAGAIGVEAVRNAPADGYTLLVGSSSALSVAPLHYTYPRVAQSKAAPGTAGARDNSARVRAR